MFVDIEVVIKREDRVRSMVIIAGRRRQQEKKNNDV